MKAIGYIRVSTNEQATQGVSLEAQRAKIRAYCDLYSLELVEVLEDAGKSAKNLNRPAMQEILDRIKRKDVEAIVILKLDRLTRSVRDLADIMELVSKRGISLVSVEEKLDTGTAAGRMVLNVMATVSQWEREIIGERTKTAMQHKKQQGQVVGTVPFGFERQGNRLVPIRQEQEAISFMRILKDSGLSFRRIADELKQRGIQTKKGGRWAHQQVKSVLQAA